MSENLPKSLQKYERLLSRTWNDKHPSEETFKKHFEFIRIVAKNETDADELNNLKAFTHESHIHFQNSIGRKGTSREKTLDVQFSETLKEIAKRFDKLRTTEKEKSVKAQLGNVGIGYEQKERKQPKSPKDVDYV
jgi:hypothetical protein